MNFPHENLEGFSAELYVAALSEVAHSDGLSLSNVRCWSSMRLGLTSIWMLCQTCKRICLTCRGLRVFWSIETPTCWRWPMVVLSGRGGIS